MRNESAIQHAPGAVELCDNCKKSLDLCVCASIQPVPTKTKVLILQHPQEPDKKLGTAQIAHLSLPNSVLKVGLSWRNLEHALGEPANPKDWAVLYLGSAKIPEAASANLVLVDKDSKPLDTSDAVLRGIKGLVVLDGTWSQAKTLWWRNAWLLKLRRAVLSPQAPSLYGKFRKEPRPESLSTLEAVTLALASLEPNLKTDILLEPFKALLGKYKPEARRRGGGRNRGRPWRRRRG